MNPLSYIVWHYTEAPIEILKIWWNFLKFFWLYLFPVPTLLKTLLSPWKKTGIGYTTRGFDPKEILQRITFEIVSRFVGFIVRAAFIIIDLAIETLLLVLGPAFFIFWLVWPAVFIYSLVKGETNFFIISLVPLPFFFIGFKNSKQIPPDEMPLEKIFREKWSDVIFERLGLERKRDIPAKILAEPETKLADFLKQKDIKEQEFKMALLWEVAKQKNIYIKKRFWRKENLFSHSGIGRDWIYGFTPLLDQYAEPISGLINYEQFTGLANKNELEMIEMILSKGNQANVLIVGEPGVGKMSLVQKFARMVNSGQISQNLAYHRVVLLNIKEAMAGLKTAGELEERLIKIFSQARAAGNMILVINDFNNLVSASSETEIGKKDISRIILPFLEGGYFQLIAITAYAGLHEQIEKHPDLLKFFEKVEAKEPDKETTFQICIDKVREIEMRIPVRITVQAIGEIIEKSELYITDAPFPEKALDLLEDTANYVSRKTRDRFVKPIHVNAVISQKTEIPIGDLTASEKEKLVKLEDILHQRVVNQEQAINEIASAMRRGRMEVAETKRPIGSFLFVGPTGVGKTETAKALAETYFGSEERMNRLDMSEFQGNGGLEKAIGSAQKGTPGFLTTLVKENPFSLLLLDEIEKADYGVLNLFLQVLDEGWITDAFGRKINFRNQIIIATSNAGAEFIRQKIESGTGDETLSKQLINHVLEKGIFRPEFLNRFDGVIMFKPLTPENLLKIAELMLNGLKKRLAKKDFVFNFDAKLVEKIAKLGYEPANGARPMRRVIQNKVEDLIAKKLLKNEIKKNVPFTVTAEEIG